MSWIHLTVLRIWRSRRQRCGDQRRRAGDKFLKLQVALGELRAKVAQRRAHLLRAVDRREMTAWQQHERRIQQSGERARHRVDSEVAVVPTPKYQGGYAACAQRFTDMPGLRRIEVTRGANQPLTALGPRVRAEKRSHAFRSSQAPLQHRTQPVRVGEW